MNKYEEALEAVSMFKYYDEYDDEMITIFNEDDKDIALLKELVDRATPKKPICPAYDLSVSCPNCGYSDFIWKEYPNGIKYCVDCGQAIDWSDEEVA